MEDGISRGLQHRHKTCCEKGGRHGRQACMVQRWFHRRDIISGQVDLYMTSIKGRLVCKEISIEFSCVTQYKSCSIVQF